MSTAMKAQELREKTAEELKTELLSTLEEQFKMRMQASAGQPVQGHLVKETRRNIARIKTILREKELSEKASKEAGN